MRKHKRKEKENKNVMTIRKHIKLSWNSNQFYCNIIER